MPLFGKLRTITQKTANLKLNPFMQVVFSDQAVKDEVVRLNTQEQLFNKGIDAAGIDLDSIGGQYAPVTVLLKQRAGLPFDRVTLFQDGDFYGSFRVQAEKDGVVIYADTIKEGFDLQIRWGNELLGLTEDSILQLGKFVRKRVKESFISLMD